MSIDDRPARRRTPLLLAIVAVAVAIRLLYFVQMSDGPGLQQHRWQESDMAFFDAWSRVVADGDWLTDRSLHPFHPWHGRLARHHLERDAADALRLGGAGEPAQRALWSEWYGGKRFHQEPLYPYALALTRLVFGDDVRWVFAWQMLLGLLSVLLIRCITVRLFGDTAGLIAAVLALLCAPLLFYEFQLLRASPLVFCGLLLVWLTMRALEGADLARWSLLGLVAGLSILLKTTHAAYVAGVLAVLLLVHARDRRRLLRTAGPLLAGVALCLAPAVARNVAVGAPALSLTSVGTIGIIFANAEGASPNGYAFLTEHGATIMASSGGAMLPAALASVATHDNIADYLGLLARRFLYIWHWVEIPNNANFYFFRMHASVLRLLPISFLTLAPLGLIGAVLGRRRFPLAWPLYLLAGTVVLSLMAFGNLSRYRLILLVCTIPFAAWTLQLLAGFLFERRYRAAALLASVLLLLTLWSGSSAARTPLRSVDYAVADAVHYLPQRRAALQRGDTAQAERVFRELLRIEPPEVRRLRGGQAPGSGFVRRTAGFYAGIYREYGYALSRAGRVDEARMMERRALELQRSATGGR